MKTNKSSSPPSCLSITSPPSSPPLWQCQESILFMTHLNWSLICSLNSTTFILSLLAWKQWCWTISLIIRRGKKQLVWFHCADKRQSSWAGLTWQHKTLQVGGLQAKEPLKCNEPVRLIFRGISISDDTAGGITRLCHTNPAVCSNEHQPYQTATLLLNGITSVSLKCFLVNRQL